MRPFSSQVSSPLVIPFEVISKAPERITIPEIWRYSLASDPDAETLDRIMHLNILPQFWKTALRGLDVRPSQHSPVPITHLFGTVPRQS